MAIDIKFDAMATRHTTGKAIELAKLAKSQATATANPFTTPVTGFSAPVGIEMASGPSTRPPAGDEKGPEMIRIPGLNPGLDYRSGKHAITQVAARTPEEEERLNQGMEEMQQFMKSGQEEPSKEEKKQDEPGKSGGTPAPPGSGGQEHADPKTHRGGKEESPKGSKW